MPRSQAKSTGSKSSTRTSTTQKFAIRMHDLWSDPGYDGGADFWTERNAGFSLLAYEWAALISDDRADTFAAWADEAVAAYLAMQLFPMYKEYYEVRSAAKGLASEPGVGDMDPARIQSLLFKRLDINYVDSVEKSDVKIERVDNGWNMKINYEVRRPLVGNLDVVGVFDISQDLTRQGATD